MIRKIQKTSRNSLLKISGENLSTNGAAVENFILEFKRKINELGLCPDQIYNADETGLVFKDLNNKTLVSHTEKTAPGRKNSKQRVTITPCVNATGRHKLPLMLIGKVKNSRCFKNCVLPDVHYRSSRNTWQTRQLFEEWFSLVFIPKVTENLKAHGIKIKALLIVDNVFNNAVK